MERFGAGKTLKEGNILGDKVFLKIEIVALGWIKWVALCS